MPKSFIIQFKRVNIMYKTIYTSLGLTLVSQAVSQQRTLEITHFAVDDGGGMVIADAATRFMMLYPNKPLPTLIFN